MSRAKEATKNRRRSKAVPVLGAAGLSLSLAGAASAASAAPAAEVLAQPAAVGHEITLREEEVADVSLATFYVFDHESAGKARPGGRLALGAGCGCGCAGCGGCGGCWTGTYYTWSVFGEHAPAPPAVRHPHKHPAKRAKKP